MTGSETYFRAHRPSRYQDRQRNPAPLMRPEGEWPLWASVGLMFVLGVIGTLLCAAIGG